MKERRRKDFDETIKKEVRRSQNYRCAYCGEYCRGHGYSEPILEVHHILPSSLGGKNTRENAIGLCPSCHERHDKEAFCNGKLFFETLLEEGRYHEVQVFLEVAGLPKRVVENPHQIKQILEKEKKAYQSSVKNAREKP